MSVEKSRTAPRRRARFINDYRLRSPDPVLKDLKFAGSGKRNDNGRNPDEHFFEIHFFAPMVLVSEFFDFTGATSFSIDPSLRRAIVNLMTL